MSYFKIIGFAFLALTGTLLFKKTKEEYSLFISLFAGIAITIAAFNLLQPVIDYIRSLDIPGSSELALLIVKSTGIAIITTVASDICKDCAEASLGARLELCGKAIILSLSLPLIKKIFDGCITMLR